MSLVSELGSPIHAMSASAVGMAPHYGPAVVVHTCSVPDTMTQLVKFRQKMVPSSTCPSDKVFVEFTAVILSTTFHWAAIDDDVPEPGGRQNAKWMDAPPARPQEDYNPWGDLADPDSSHGLQPTQAAPTATTSWDFREKDAQASGATAPTDDWASYSYAPKSDKWQDPSGTNAVWQDGAPDPWAFKEEWEQHHTMQHTTSWQSTEWCSTGSSDPWTVPESEKPAQSRTPMPVPLAPKPPPPGMAVSPPPKVVAASKPAQTWPIDQKTGLPTKPPPPMPPPHVGRIGPPPLGPKAGVPPSASGRTLLPKGTPPRPLVTGTGKVGDGQDKQVTWADQQTVIQRETSLLRQSQQ